jgi:hypothetical protein
MAAHAEIQLPAFRTTFAVIVGYVVHFVSQQSDKTKHIHSHPTASFGIAKGQNSTADHGILVHCIFQQRSTPCL